MSTWVRRQSAWFFDFFQSLHHQLTYPLGSTKSLCTYIFSASSKSVWLYSFFIQASCIGSVFQLLHVSIDQSFFFRPFMVSNRALPSASDFVVLLADCLKYLHNFLPLHNFFLQGCTCAIRHHLIVDGWITQRVKVKRLGRPNR